MPTQKLVFKILRTKEWEDFKKNKHFVGSDDDKRDGFIHLSNSDQVPQTLKRYFSEEKEVYILECLFNENEKALKWEASRGGELFPHLYRELRRTDIQKSYIKNLKNSL